MQNAILNLMEGATEIKSLTKAEICQNVLEILVDMNTKHYSFEFAHRDAVQQYAKDRFLEKHGTLEPQSWQADAYDLGCTSPITLRASLDRCHYSIS